MEIRSTIKESIELKTKILQDEHLMEAIHQSYQLAVHALKSGSRVFWCGNGGSAADAQHLSSELSGRFYLDRTPLNSEALHVNSSYLTAVANDYGYEAVYARAIAAKANAGDILICLSTSGKSKNILRAIEQAEAIGLKIICLTGQAGIDTETIPDVLIKVPSKDTPRIQEAHMLIGHIICEQIEKDMFSN